MTRGAFFVGEVETPGRIRGAGGRPPALFQAGLEDVTRYREAAEDCCEHEPGGVLIRHVDEMRDDKLWPVHTHGLVLHVG